MTKTKTPLLSPRFGQAFQLASSLHAKQIRKDSGEPYIAHLMAVCSLVLESGGQEDQAIAALLHDAAEDCGGKPTLEIIRREFGERVAAIVEGCTDTFESPKPAWRPRKEAYIEHLRTAPADVRLVATADKLHNARSIVRDYRVHGEAVWERFNKHSDQIWYYRAVLEALQQSGANALVEELDRVVREMYALAGREWETQTA